MHDGGGVQGGGQAMAGMTAGTPTSTASTTTFVQSAMATTVRRHAVPGWGKEIRNEGEKMAGVKNDQRDLATR